LTAGFSRKESVRASRRERPETVAGAAGNANAADRMARIMQAAIERKRWWVFTAGRWAFFWGGEFNRVVFVSDHAINPHTSSEMNEG
jgi:hypothetical protein